jgi:hypothetical protein
MCASSPAAEIPPRDLGYRRRLGLRLPLEPGRRTSGYRLARLPLTPDQIPAAAYAPAASPMTAVLAGSALIA